MIFAGNCSILPELRPNTQSYIDFCLRQSNHIDMVNQEISQQEDRDISGKMQLRASTSYKVAMLAIGKTG